MADFAKHIYMLLESEMAKKEAEEKDVNLDEIEENEDACPVCGKEPCICEGDDDYDLDELEDDSDEDEDDEKEEKEEVNESAQQKLEILAQIQKDLGKAELPVLKRVFKLVSGQDSGMVQESIQANYDILTQINANLMGCPISVLKRIAKIVAERDSRDPQV